jgi:hypothetical protein
MAELLTVFKNVNTVTPSTNEQTGATALDIIIKTTGANEKAVIKDIDFKALGTGKSRVKPVLDLDGHTHTTGADGALSVNGNLIMGPSSTLKIKSATTAATNPAGGFKGFAFFEGSSGIQRILGNGISTSMTPTRMTSSNTACDDAVAALNPGDGLVYFYNTYNNVIDKHNTAGTLVATWTHGSTGYSITADDTYLYRGGSGGGTSIWRTKLSDQTYSNLTTSGSYTGPAANQGSIFVHHAGKIYTRGYGNDAFMDIIDLTTLAVTRKSDSNFSLGSYSDGGCIVTTTAGKSYVVEQGTNYWYYYDIEGGAVTRTAGATNGSTEYAQGGAEIAPGVALIFSELSDQCSLIDMNTSPPTWTFGTSTPYIDSTPAFGNRFGFAGWLDRASEFTYSAFATGIEIT